MKIIIIFMLSVGIIQTNFFNIDPAIKINTNNIEYQETRNYYNKFAVRYDTSVEIIEYIYNLCLAYEIDFYIMLALVHTESRFVSDAVSVTGAYGYCQIFPIVLRDIGKNSLDIYNTEDNILIGVLYMKELTTRYEYDITNALIHYNTGTRIDLKKQGINYANKILKEAKELENV